VSEHLRLSLTDGAAQAHHAYQRIAELIVQPIDVSEHRTAGR